MLKNNIPTIIVLWIISILCTVFIVKTYWPNTETIEIVKTITGETTYHPGDSTYEDCAKSPLKVKTDIKNNIIYGNCSDDCKDIDFTIYLKTRNNRKHIFGIEYMLQNNIGNSYGLYYLYNFNIVWLGGGVIFNKKNIGIDIKAQRSF